MDSSSHLPLQSSGSSVGNDNATSGSRVEKKDDQESARHRSLGEAALEDVSIRRPPLKIEEAILDSDFEKGNTQEDSRFVGLVEKTQKALSVPLYLRAAADNGKISQ